MTLSLSLSLSYTHTHVYMHSLSLSLSLSYWLVYFVPLTEALNNGINNQPPWKSLCVVSATRTYIQVHMYMQRIWCVQNLLWNEDTFFSLAGHYAWSQLRREVYKTTYKNEDTSSNKGHYNIILRSVQNSLSKTKDNYKMQSVYRIARKIWRFGGLACDRQI